MSTCVDHDGMERVKPAWLKRLRDSNKRRFDLSSPLADSSTLSQSASDSDEAGVIEELRGMFALYGRHPPSLSDRLAEFLVPQSARNGDPRTRQEYQSKQENRRGPSAVSVPKNAVIPRFYFKRDPGNDLKNRIRKEARTRFLEGMAESLLDEDELDHLWDVIKQHVSPPLHSVERINYKAFRKAGSELPVKTHVFFEPRVFLSFPRDEYCRISARALFYYIVRKITFTQLRISLTCYDEVGNGYLREKDLENYTIEQIPMLAQFQNLDPDFYSYYVFTAVRKFVFFLDPLRRGRISIRDIASSHVIHEFSELRQPCADDVDCDKNWFSAQAALNVYTTYLNLDEDRNGMLSKEEFGHFNGSSLTNVTVDRLFQEYRMYRSEETGNMEMDYKTFLDFVLALQNKDTKPGIHYFWKILDVDHRGYLTLATLNYFFRAVVKKLVQHDNDPVRVEDVTNEIFDMVRPKDPLRITLQDLIDSGAGHTVISILTDVTGFWQYDNREALLAQEDDF